MLKRLRHTPNFFLRSIASFFFLVGCGKPTSLTHHYKSPFELSQKKVHLAGTEFPAGTSLAVLKNEDCVNSRMNNSFQIYLPNSEKTHKIVLDHTMSLSELEKIANEDPCIIGISHNLLVTTEEIPTDSKPEATQSQDPLLEKQTHLNLIQAKESYRTFFDPANGIKNDVIIAVIDTGIDLNHTDLKDNLWVNEKELHGKPDVDDDKDGYVDDIYGYNFVSQIGDPSHETLNDHGTHVAGLAAAILSNGEGGAGVMGERVRIMALNIFGKNWAAETFDIDTAIRFAADHGAHVINISMGAAGRSETTAATIAYALNQGCLVISSAGNLHQNIDEEFFFPASYAPDYPGLISVGAQNTQKNALCDFSNFGAESVKIAAPGCDDQALRSGLFSTLAKNHYGYKKGTSMAAPLISGAVALAYGLIRDRRGGGPVQANEIEEIVLRSTTSLSEIEPFIQNGRSLNLKKLADEINRMYP